MTTRRAEIAANLAGVRARIDAACDSIGRDPGEVTLVAVTKTFPASDVRILAELGVTDVGENRDQEARPKHEECADLPVRWHFVGQLQRNKCRSVVGYADVVHSVDRLSLVAALSKAAVATDRRVTALVEVNLDPGMGEGSSKVGEGRGGVPLELADELADAIAAAPGLALGGLMAVAPLGEDPGPAFAQLAEVADRIRAEHPDAGILSAGMSADLEAAIRHGATHVRIGTALLGHRAAPVG